MRIILLFIGIVLLLLQQFVYPFSAQLQFIFFIAGIVLLGIPHGAADMLVATENAPNKKAFSAKKFHFNYVIRLAVFALLFWLFPVATNLLFIGIAAFHFGETGAAAEDSVRFASCGIGFNVSRFTVCNFKVPIDSA